MTARDGLRCRHAFEALAVHANGEVVCSIIDGRGEFVLGNVHHESLHDILDGTRMRDLRRLMLSRRDSFCPAVGKRCPLKSIPTRDQEEVPTSLRFLMIEPTTACDLRCLTCPVRAFTGDVTWRDAYRDGGVSFAVWDGARRAKQYAADAVRRILPHAGPHQSVARGRATALLTRGRIPRSRNGTLPPEVLERVVTEAGDRIERLDLFNYGEPFLYRHLIRVLRHVRRVMPSTIVVVSTDGMQVRPEVQDAIVAERLLDDVVFSVDGCDEDSYRRYRIRGRFETAFANMLRFHDRARGSSVRVIWQYVVFRWNDSDDQLQRAIAMAERAGIPIWFDFAHTWGRSRRKADDLRYLTPYLRPFTALPDEARQEGW